MRFIRALNIADWFSFYRILAAPFLIAVLLLGSREWFSGLLALSYSTDALDGYLARRLGISSARGAQLDSLGDQITLALGLFGLGVFEWEFIRVNMAWIALAFIPYLIQMSIAFLKYGRATAFHTYLAKLSAILQATFILWALFFEPVTWVFFVVVFVGVLETIEEITLIFMYDTWVKDVKSYFWALGDKRRNRDAS